MKDFWKRAFSDNGEPSFSRVGTAVALAFVCGWITEIVMHSKALPDFTGACLFIGTLYGLNVVKNFGAAKPPTP
jgi:hypothetical protein